jgi:intein-encoded DNA endonuclease-like protein
MKENYDVAEKEYTSSKITLRNVCTKYNICRPTFSVYLKNKGVSLRKKVSADDTIFDVIDTEEKAYWLGFLYADGSISYKTNFPTRYVCELTLQKQDLEHIQKFKDFLKTEQKIEYREKVQAYRLMISSKYMVESLIDKGCIPKKSLVLKFPTKEQVPEHLQKAFIRGYFDGDGCLSLQKNGRLANLTILGTEEFLLDLAKNLNLIYSLKKEKQHVNNTWNLPFLRFEGIWFLNYIYHDSTIHLNRKYEKYLKAFQFNYYTFETKRSKCKVELTF